ncbi:MAG TPA: sulfotransferase [Pyrinomonadaceae bacterium]|nr:sulfotransferase [Pyrinomonadaceae bacterium]
MLRPKPLFIMGNKRSGTTLVTDLLNSHPNVFVSHEADIAWILYQARNGRPAHFETHRLDSRLMLDSTLKSCRRVLKQSLSNEPGNTEIVEAFYRCQTRLMQQYLRPSLKQRLKRIAKIVGKRPTLGRVLRAMKQNPELLHKNDLAWIGDKKHAQHLDPEVRQFLQQQFPEARYIHVLRHPRSVVASTVEAARTWSETPEYFKGVTEQILEQWAIHEEWVLQAKEREASPILTVRLEDLWSEPIRIMTNVLNFLDLNMSDGFADLVKQIVYPKDPNLKYASFPLPDVPRARRIMEIYGYSEAARAAGQ